jgi:hypothetical protein
LGSQTYDQSELLVLLDSPSVGDASLILAKQLIAAKLNFANGSELGPFVAPISIGDQLLSGFAGKLPYNVRPSSIVGLKMVGTALILKHYNSRRCEF